jgi:hypothetical protein
MNTSRKMSAQTASERFASLSRRRFLRGLGVCLSLPAFESLGAFTAGAAEKSATGLATTSTGAPLRMAFLYIPNGVHQDNWWPKTEGNNFELTPTIAPLAKVRNQLQIIGGLEHLNATAGSDGAGDHARANATFLTGMRARKTAGADIHVGVSIDQVVAQKIGYLTRFPSLELSCDSVRKSGKCDSGYSCAYQYNISWQSPSTPLAPEPNPRLVFERLFGAGTGDERKKSYQSRQDLQKSVLDFVLDDAKTLEKKLGKQDQQKLDEYLTSVREIEGRITRSENFGLLPEPGIDTPAGIPADYGSHMEMMFDLLALAFQTDSTRIATLLLAGDGNNRAFPQIGIPEGHHFLSHHRGDEEKMTKLSQIDLYYAQHFAKFLEKLDGMKDVDGKSVLHNSMIVYGSGHSDGNKHTHANLPIVLAGGGGGTLAQGRYIRKDQTPACNLFLTLTDRMGVKGLPRFGDSTGRVEAI